MTTSPPIDFVRGDATGLDIPAHGDALQSVGEDFLTEAFQKFGSLAADNKVARIVRFVRCPGGSTGAKFFLTVEYARPDPALHTELFVKFSRDFVDKQRDNQGRYEMASEARFAPISRLPGFPISVPIAYFADFHQESGTGLIITQTIPFGQGNIEKQHVKCGDDRLDDPLPYYEALIPALAQLAAAHKAGRLAPDIDARFPIDPVAVSADPILYDDAGLRAKLAECAEFVTRGAQLVPPEVSTPDFIAKLEREAYRIRDNEKRIQAYLKGNPDLIALCHWNAQIDNAWFWRDAENKLEVGLIDWGRVNQLTMGSALWGCLSAAHHDIWTDHLEDLVALFAREYHANGGPDVSADELMQHFMVHIGAMSIARLLEFPFIILLRSPDAYNASGPHDPMIQHVESSKNLLHIFVVFLKLVQSGKISAAMDRLLAR